ncbi:RTA1 like [Pyrenophora seminiperda CCB06]|uniref:RTA1 like n=1 Tax=Pyrenophora seminiperda CCB06 TaxID=1302712 RepID=A0A3M7M8I5_9PLEO|nr:RTA1 like [Pyrenophora seminiperda CCB06]
MYRNGPSALILSYILHGHIPYYIGGHHDAILDTKLQNAPNLLHLTPDLYAHFLSSLRYSTQALPVNTLLDTLIRPNADTELNPKSCVEWRYEPEKAIVHVVVGETAHAGGQWAENPVSASVNIGTLSYAEQLSLPGYSYADHLAKNGKQDETEFVRPSRAEVADYLRAYPEAVGISDSVFTDLKAEQVYRTVKGFSIGSLGMRCKHLVLASGIFTVNIPPPPLLAPIAQLDSQKAPLLVIGSGFSAADVIISTPPTRRIIHIYKWAPEDRPSPLRGCHHTAYPEYATVYRQMKLSAIVASKKGKTAKSPSIQRKSNPFQQRDWSLYEGLPNAEVVSVSTSAGVATVELRSRSGGIILREVGGLAYVVGRRGTLDFISPELRSEILSAPDYTTVDPSSLHLISSRTLRTKAEVTSLEVARNVFIIGSLTGDTLIRHAVGGMVGGGLGTRKVLNFTELVTIMDRAKTRKSHKKSRNGCLPCKTRHVKVRLLVRAIEAETDKEKCDEQRPNCGNCVKHGTASTCEYRPSRSREASMASPLPTSTSTFTPSSTDGTGNIHDQQPLPEFGPLLTNGASATTELTLNISQMRLLHHWMTVTAKSLAVHTDAEDVFADTFIQISFSNPYLLQAALSLSALHMSRLRGSDEAQEYSHQAEKYREAALYSFQTTVRDIDESNYKAVLLFASTLFPHGCAASLSAGDDLELAFSTIVSNIDIDWQTEEQPPNTELVRLRKFSEIVHHVYPPDIVDAYGYACHVLELVFQVAASSPKPPSDALLKIWIHLISDRYVELLSEKQPGSLIIFAHFAVVVDRAAKHYWYMDGVAEQILRFADHMVPSEWKSWLEWPREQIRRTSIPSTPYPGHRRGQFEHPVVDPPILRPSSGCWGRTCALIHLWLSTDGLVLTELEDDGYWVFTAIRDAYKSGAPYSESNAIGDSYLATLVVCTDSNLFSIRIRNSQRPLFSDLTQPTMSSTDDSSAPKYVLWPYTPTVAAGAIAAIVMFILFFAHVFLLVKHRTWFCIPFVVGALVWHPSYIIYTRKNVILTVSSTSIYMILGRLMRRTKSTGYSLVRATWVTKIFVGGDVLCFMIQGGGAGILVSANDDAGFTRGENIILGGLVLQILIFGFFIVVAGIWHARLARQPSAVSTDLPWGKLMLVLYVSSVCIALRNVGRVIEYGMGQNGYLLTHEWPIYIYDFLLMAITLAICVVWYGANIKEEKKRDIEFARI